ncbi:MAG: hypothetical protein WAT68_10420 [Candidatus Nitrotoga sp.]
MSFLLDQLYLAIDLVDALLLTVLGRFDALAQFCHHHLQTFRCEDFIGHAIQNQIVQMLHRKVFTCASMVALALTAGAFVIFVAA